MHVLVCHVLRVDPRVDLRPTFMPRLNRPVVVLRDSPLAVLRDSVLRDSVLRESARPRIVFRHPPRPPLLVVRLLSSCAEPLTLARIELRAVLTLEVTRDLRAANVPADIP